MSHSAAPWKVLSHLNRIGVDPNRPNVFADYIIVGSQDGEVCRVPNGSRSDGELFNTKALATAKLIAAAPEMLAACQLLCSLENNNVDDADTRWKQVRADIREAISRATT